MKQNPGILYVVATPIGNLGDITLRAIETLKNVDFIICEDSRISGNLLKHLEIKKPMVSINEFNEENEVFNVLKKLETQSAALISDAGTPLISDPGFRIVNLAQKRGIQIVPIPGATALIAALSISGLPTDKFTFLGFPPKSQVRTEKLLNQYKNLEQTIILYESPHRILKTLEAIKNVFGDIDVAIARELTKIHEEINKKNISVLIAKYEKVEPKGEIVILFSAK